VRVAQVVQPSPLYAGAGHELVEDLREPIGCVGLPEGVQKT